MIERRYIFAYDERKKNALRSEADIAFLARKSKNAAKSVGFECIAETKRQCDFEPRTHEPCVPTCDLQLLTCDLIRAMPELMLNGRIVLVDTIVRKVFFSFRRYDTAKKQQRHQVRHGHKGISTVREHPNQI